MTRSGNWKERMMTEPLADRRIPAGDDYLSREELDAITPRY